MPQVWIRNAFGDTPAFSGLGCARPPAESDPQGLEFQDSKTLGFLVSGSRVQGRFFSSSKEGIDSRVPAR